MSFYPDVSPSNLSERLTPSSIRDLSSIILRNENPVTSAEIIPPLLELVGEQRNAGWLEYYRLG